MDIKDIKNPYTSSVDEYGRLSQNQGGFLGLGDIFGNKRAAMQTNQAKAREQAALFDSQLQLMQYQNEYNSPSAMAQRMRDAGLNPDLLGLDAATSVDGPAMSPTDIVPMPSGQAIDAAGLISTVVSIFGGVQGLVAGAANIAGKRLTNSQQGLKVAETMAGLFAGQNLDTLGDPSVSHVFDPNYMRRNLGFSRRESKYLTQQMQSYINNPSVRNAAFRSSNDAWDARRDYFIRETSPLTSSGRTYSDMVNTIKPISKYMYDIYTMGLSSTLSKYRSEFAKNERDYDYYVSYDSTSRAMLDNLQTRQEYDYTRYLDPQIRARAENFGFESSAETSKAGIIENSAYRKMLDRLYERSQQGDLFSTALLFIAPFFRQAAGQAAGSFGKNLAK